MFFNKRKEEEKNKLDDGKKLSDFMQETPQVRGVKKIIAVASAKGGVGKSTIAANLAKFLASNGQNVALVDADIYGPSIPNLMEIQNIKPEQKDGLIIPIISQKVKTISIGSLVSSEKAGVWRGPMVTKILHQLIRNVNWAFDGSEVDIMIIDMPPGTGDVYLSMSERFPLNGVIAVSTPSELAIIDLVKSLDCFVKLKIPILGVIQNMSYLENNGEKKYIFGRDGAKEFAKKNKIEFLGDIPISQNIDADFGKDVFLKTLNILK